MNKFLIIIVSVFTLVSCTNTDETKTQKETPFATSIKLTDEQIKNAGIETDTLHQRELANELAVQGKVVNLPNGTSFISFPIVVQIQSISVRIGDYVKKGQTLALAENINLIEMQENYLRTKANWEFAKEDYNRQQQLDRNNATSLKLYQQAKSTYDGLTATLNSLEKQLELIGISTKTLTPQNIAKNVAIKSNLDGIIASIDIQKGAFTMPDKPLITVIDEKATETQLQIFQQDLASIKVGTEVTSDYQNQSLKGKIRSIVPSVDASNSALAIVEWEKVTNNPIPGVMLNVKILNQKTAMQVVPSEAVIHWNTKSFVFIETGKNQFEMIEIKTLIKQDKLIGIEEVKTKLKDKKIITKGAYSILMALENVDKEK